MKTTERGCKQCDVGYLCVFLINTNANERDHTQTRAASLAKIACRYIRVAISVYELNLLELPQLSNIMSQLARLYRSVSLGNSINHLKHCLARAIREIKHLAAHLVLYFTYTTRNNALTYTKSSNQDSR